MAVAPNYCHFAKNAVHSLFHAIYHKRFNKSIEFIYRCNLYTLGGRVRRHKCGTE